MASQGEEQLIWNRLLYKEKPSLRQLVLSLQEAGRAPPLSSEKQARTMDDLEALEFNLDKLDLIRLANIRDIAEYEELALSLKADLEAARRDSVILAERLVKAQQVQAERIKNEALAEEVNRLRSQEDLQTQLRTVREETRREKDAIHQMEQEIALKQQALLTLWQVLHQLTDETS